MNKFDHRNFEIFLIDHFDGISNPNTYTIVFIPLAHDKTRGGMKETERWRKEIERDRYRDREIY